MIDLLDLGSGTRLRLARHPDSDKPTGGIIEHDCDQNDPETSAEIGQCSGSIFFDVPWVREHFSDRPRWTVESWEPLTISPSIRTTHRDAKGEHEHHGYIREGRWVPA